MRPMRALPVPRAGRGAAPRSTLHGAQGPLLGGQLPVTCLPLDTRCPELEARVLGPCNPVSQVCHCSTQMTPVPACRTGVGDRGRPRMLGT